MHGEYVSKGVIGTAFRWDAYESLEDNEYFYKSDVVSV